MKIINGDPITFENNKYKVKIDWLDRVFYDQLTAYEDDVTYNQHANEDLGWIETLEQIVDKENDVDLSVRWFVYRGKSCSDSKAPMVICFDEYFETSWQRIADREGLVILTFEYHRNIRVPDDALGKPEFGVRPDEIKSYKIVVDRVIKEQNIDACRIYCNGISYGDMATLFYAKEYGDTLAGIANINGPTSRYNIERFGLDKFEYQLPVLQIRGEDDMSCDGYPAGLALDVKGNWNWQRNVRSHTSVINRNLWLDKNGYEDVFPEIYTDRNRMFLRYNTESYPVIFNELADSAHLVPVDYSEVIWELIFNRFKRNEKGELVEITEKSWPKDEFSCGLVAGTDKAYINHKVTDLEAACIIVEPFEELNEFSEFYAKPQVNYASFYAPAELMKKFFNIEYAIEDKKNHTNWLWGRCDENIKLDDKEVTFSANGRNYRMFTNSSLVMIDDFAYSMGRPLLVIKDTLMIPVAEFAEMLGYYTSERNDAIYITDHKISIGYTFARILREEILTGSIAEYQYEVKVLETENGSVETSAKTVSEGHQLDISYKAEDGFTLDKMIVTINGLEVPVYENGDRYCVYNVLGDVTVKGLFKNEDN